MGEAKRSAVSAALAAETASDRTKTCDDRLTAVASRRVERPKRLFASGTRRDAAPRNSFQTPTQCIDTPILTTNHVRGETWTYLRRKVGHAAAVQFLDVLERSARVTVRSIPAQHEAEALTWVRQHDEREYSFVDATSFVTMRRLRIDQVSAFDGDFTAAGFVELRP
ncbi:MAG: type II toxin-antitoxin system VapC family toxin [Egibacteraceae bacterium]